MDVAFVLPNIQRKPGGGAKIVYQYANYIARKGNKVTIYYMTDRFLKGKLPDLVRKSIGKVCSHFCPLWYRLDDNVLCTAAFDINDLRFDHDVIIATAVMTAFFVDGLEGNSKKYYFIQGFETFYTSEDEVYRSYDLNMDKIVVSTWLQRIVSKRTSMEPYLIPNGIDLEIFKVSTDIKKRARHSIVFHYRKAPLKGCEYAIKVVEKLMTLYGDLEVSVVGNVVCPEPLKGKCRYYSNISEWEVSQINNQARVFICTSIEEGFGLPGLEAMACGCALITTDFEGSKEYAIDGMNALVVPPRDVKALLDSIIRVFDDDDLAFLLSKNGVESSKRFDIQNSTQQFYKLLL